MVYTLSTVINPVLPSLVYVAQTWLQGVKLLVSKPPLCFCCPGGTFDGVLTAADGGYIALQTQSLFFHLFPKVLRINTAVKGTQLGENEFFSEAELLGWSPTSRFLCEVSINTWLCFKSFSVFYGGWEQKLWLKLVNDKIRPVDQIFPQIWVSEGATPALGQPQWVSHVPKGGGEQNVVAMGWRTRTAQSRAGPLKVFCLAQG